MGYESRLYVCEKHTIHKESGEPLWTFLEKVATFYMSVTSEKFINVFSKELPEDWELYGEDGNTLLKEDKYGDKLHFASARDVLDVLNKELSKEYYRRYAMLRDCLRQMINARDKWDELIIVHYGY